MKIVIILLIIVIFLIVLGGSTFANLQDKTYTLNTPGFGDETYTLPDLTSEDITLDDKQYSVFVKYMNIPKIATFMSDNSQVTVPKLDEYKKILTSISGNTISYNQAVGINSGTPSGRGQSNPATTFQINRTLLIIDVMGSLAKLYCSNNKANSDENKYITNCVSGDILAELERFYYLKPGNELSLDPLLLDYNVYVAIWNALKNRHTVFISRLAKDTCDKL